MVDSGQLPEAVRSVRIEITDTKQPEHGDYACNFALTASKAAGMNPRQVGELVKEALTGSTGVPPVPPSTPLSGSNSNPLTGGTPVLPGEAISSVELAGPGFLNFRLNPTWVASFVSQVLEVGSDFGRHPPSAIRDPQSINVEFVSVNPNGPITIGSGRGAAYGSTLCNVLEAEGNRVHREYYINDGVNSEQMRLFAESVRAICLGKQPPENGYKGDYVWRTASEAGLTLTFAFTHGIDLRVPIARGIQASNPGMQWGKNDIAGLPLSEIQVVAQEAMLRAQKEDLATFGVVFNTWFSEQSLHDSGEVAKEIDKMVASGVADDEEVRTVLKLARGGVIEDVEKQDQAGKVEEDDAPGTADLQIGEQVGNNLLAGKEDTSSGADLEISGPSAESTPHSPQATSHTLWLRSTKFGDDMDRVLKRRDGRLTYIASDVAYHKDKLTDASGTRGTGPVDRMITILGPDHHGYIGRLQAVVAAMLVAESGVATLQHSGSEMPEHRNAETPPLSDIEAKLYSSPEERDTCQAALADARQKLEVQIYQLVRFMKDGKPAPMRKRDGNIYALIDLMREIGENVKPNGTEEEKLEVGKDVARFFYLMRSHDTTFDFDLDLAQKQSDENPVFYVQYAHARICSVIGKAGESGISVLRHDGVTGDSTAKPQRRNAEMPNTGLLTHEKELSLIKKICDLPFEVQRCAEDYGVHRLTTYAIELARTYHHFYDACRVIQPDQPELSQARLAICEATRLALKGTLNLLGISAPERM